MAGEQQPSDPGVRRAYSDDEEVRVLQNETEITGKLGRVGPLDAPDGP